MYGEELVTYGNAHEKLRELGAALSIETRTRGEIQQQELQTAQAAANASALSRRSRPAAIGLNVPA